MLVEAAVEERVRRALIDDFLVGDPGVGELLVELREILWRRGLVVAGQQQQERSPHLRDHIADAGRNPVEADRAHESGLRRGLSP